MAKHPRGIQRVERDSGPRWIVRYYENGKGSQQKSQTFSTLRAAKIFKADQDLQRELGEQLYRRLKSTTLTFDGLAERWWNARERVWTYRTRRRYASLLDCWVLPLLGGVLVRTFDVDRANQFMNDLLDCEATDSAANGARAVVSSMLSWGVPSGWAPQNAMLFVPPQPQLRSDTINARLPELIETIRFSMLEDLTDLSYIERFGAYTFVGCAAYEGPRPSELFAWRWSTVFDELMQPRRFAAVNQAVTGERGSLERRIGYTKNRVGREIRLFEPVLADLLELYELQGRPARDSFIWLAEDGMPYHETYVWLPKFWRPAFESSGVGYFRLGECRHTAAQLLGLVGDRASALRLPDGTPVPRGWPPEKSAPHLGHTPAVMFSVYRHLWRPEEYADVDQPIEDLILLAQERVRTLRRSGRSAAA